MKTYNIKDKIKEYFFVNPTSKLRVRQIERELRLPLPSVIRYCRELEKEGIIKKELVSGISTYSADRISKSYITGKRLFNLKSIFESGILEYLIKEYSNPVIVLFGSYSRGEDIENSDIDLYVETPSKKYIKLDGFATKLKRAIQVFNYSNIGQINNAHLRNNLVNGVVLNNFLEVFK